MTAISIALSKGRIFEETAPLLARVGIRPRSDPERSRKLVLATNRREVRLIVVRASDTPTYVERGGADLGIAGAIVDLVATGNTLKANDLVAVEEIMRVSARLIVNQAALKTKRAALQPLIEAFARAAAR